MVVISAGLCRLSLDSISLMFQSSLSKMYFVVVFGVAVTQFLGVKIIEEWDDASKAEKVRRLKEKYEKAERKQHLRFEGKYSVLFYKVIWHDLRYNLRNYHILVLSGSLIAVSAFGGLGAHEVLKMACGGENAVLGFGITPILIQFLLLLFLIAAIVISFGLIYYFKSQMRHYGIFVTLGIRRKTLFSVVIAEILSCIIFSMVNGMFGGTLLVLLFRKGMGSVLKDSIILGNLSLKTYVMFGVYMLAVYLVALAMAHDIFGWLDISRVKEKVAEPEKLPARFRYVGVCGGVIFAGWAICRFSRREMAEGVTSILVFLIGLYFLVRNGWGILLQEKRKNYKRYFSTLMKKNNLYHKFGMVTKYVFAISILHICALFVFSKGMISSIIEENPETLLPYDFVCLATEEDFDVFGKLEQECDGEVCCYPMMRVTNVDNTEMPQDYRECVMPQGQHIGISETTYRKLREKTGKIVTEKLNLDECGERVYVVYQESLSVKAHPIDYFLERTKPYIHVGQPLIAYAWQNREIVYPQRTVIGESRQILTGALNGGRHENIIVFSDEYFTSMQDSWQRYNCYTGEEVSAEEAAKEGVVYHWPTQLVLIKIPERNLEKAQIILQEMENNHIFDSQFDGSVKTCYSKIEVKSQIITERMMSIIINGMFVCIMLMVSLFITYMKTAAELPDIAKKGEFLRCMGMRRKEWIGCIKAEVRRVMLVPLIIGLISASIFTIIVWQIRWYSLETRIAYIKVWFLILGFYVLVHFLWLKYLEIYVIRNMERGKYGNSYN